MVFFLLYLRICLPSWLGSISPIFSIQQRRCAMRTASVLLQTIAGIGMLGMAWMLEAPRVLAQQPVIELGMPAPGTTRDFEDTRKQPDPAQMHSPESNQQVTLGGAQSVVEGEIWKIDGQTFEIRKTN